MFNDTVTTGALVKRINRRLTEQGRKLKKTRGGGWRRHDLGDYHAQDLYRNDVVRRHVKLDALARELGVLADSEEVVE
jgi:hypothetical protein